MTDLDARRLAALDSLLRVLDLEPCGSDRFRAVGAPGAFPRTFGGQLVAEALVAAGATVEDKAPSSLHAYFAAGGTPTEPVDIDVRRVRDGRAMATREVGLRHGDRTLLTMIAAFHDRAAEHGPPDDRVRPGPGPLELPTLQDWLPEAPAALAEQSTRWVEHPPPVEIRIGEPPVFLGGTQTVGPRSHWMRLARGAADDDLLQAALLAHASDYLLLDMAFRSHPVPFSTGKLSGSSLDHSVWFHRPVRFERWHRYTQETVTLAGERGLVRGAIHDEDGRLVASTAQEVLVRAADEPDRR